LASSHVRLDTIAALADRGRDGELAVEVRALRTVGDEIHGDVREAIAELRTRPEPGPSPISSAARPPWATRAYTSRPS
jgi:hypothetical protein